jgi:two-component system, OmpR family, sensor histidine kinase KdpD
VTAADSTADAAAPANTRLTRARMTTAALLGMLGLAALTAVLTHLRTNLVLASIVLIYLAAVVAIAAVGGLWPGIAAAVASDLLVNFFFVEPLHTFTVEHGDNLITLLVYVGVAVTVAVAIDLAARQRAAAARVGIESALLARITAEPIGQGSVITLLTHVRDTLGMDTAALIHTGHRPHIVAIVGPPPTDAPTLAVPAGDGLQLVVDGPAMFAPDPKFLTRLAAAANHTWQAERLAADAAAARELAEIDRLRTALLTAVGHDLRTPLAGIKASVSSLRDPDIPLTEPQQAELLETIEESADRMDALVENLLAMSRLRAGALSVHPRPVALDDVVAAALIHTPHAQVVLDIPEQLPAVQADPGLLERAIANIIANADKARPAHLPIAMYATSSANQVHLYIADRGPGVPPEDRERIFAPFQRLDDTSATGLGLGLAIARGFTEAMAGTLTVADTLGGGLTMILTLPVAEQERT